MTDDEISVRKREGVQRMTFRNDSSDKSVISFNKRLLPGSLRITVKYGGSRDTIFRVFKADRILKFSSIIS